MPVVVSFYCGPPGYKDHADQLRASCERHGLEHDIRELPDPGSWAGACLAKPTFIRDALDRHGRPVLWVDADARVVASLDDEGAILRADGLTTEPFPWDSEAWRVGMHWWTGRGREGWAAGTVAVRPGAESFLEAWAKACARAPRGWSDQDALANVDEAAEAVTPMSPALSYVFDLTREQYPTLEPVILHLQASRKLARGPRR